MGEVLEEVEVGGDGELLETQRGRAFPSEREDRFDRLFTTWGERGLCGHRSPFLRVSDARRASDGGQDVRHPSPSFRSRGDTGMISGISCDRNRQAVIQRGNSVATG